MPGAWVPLGASPDWGPGGGHLSVKRDSLEDVFLRLVGPEGKSEKEED
jgi:hypothetical protein